MAKIAPMLKTLGYEPESRNPYYGKPDQERIIIQIMNNLLELVNDTILGSN